MLNKMEAVGINLTEVDLEKVVFAATKN